jgi:DNA segregation ATPase FtsK/SpoIIIE, S-DNA-T family
MTEEDELVFKAGLLFLERQRVAVSMLQREFSLDFEAATRVLDRLQAAGLIGPYLGGQRRDILLTLEQWRSRAVAR